MKFFGLDKDGKLWDLCDCGDFDAACESAADLNVGEMIWIANEHQVLRWHRRISNSLAPKLKQHRLEEACDAAMEAFWEAVVDAYPEAQSGDFPFSDICNLEDTSMEAIKTWLYYNAPDCKPNEGEEQ